MKGLLTTVALSAFLTMVGPGTTFAQESKAFDSLQMKDVAVVNVPVDADAAVSPDGNAVMMSSCSGESSTTQTIRAG